MPYFFMKLLGPRPTFPMDITPEERDIMNQHGAYWTEQIKRGKALVLGPVADPNGPFGMGVIRADDAAEAGSLTAHDPAILSDRGFTCEVHMMLGILLPEGM